MAQLDGTPVAVEPAAPATPPPMPIWNFGSTDMNDISALDDPMATVLFSDADATEVGSGGDTDGEGTGYVPRSMTELMEHEQAGTAGLPTYDPVEPDATVPPATDRQTAPDAPATPPAPPSDATKTDAPPAPPEVEALRTELESLKSVKEYVDSDDFKNVKIVAEELFKDPATFIQQYLPHVVEQLGIREAARTAETPQQFAREYMEQKLSEKYGEEFTYSPHDAGFRGTQSYDYDVDRQLFLQEGFSAYYGEQQRTAQMAEQRTQAAVQAATSVGERFGLSDAEVHQALTQLDAIESDPIATYYEMAFTWLQATGKLPAGSRGTAPPNGAAKPAAHPNQMPRRPEPVPAPGVASTPAASSEPVNAVLAEIAGDFPVDFLMEGIHGF